ncbi:hypothetical protein A3Q34_09490 [Colwellia sp. PAMC 20917]|uniref:oligosaccharide flippase family protein n=1 Tax=Colwellia sp. PAMC 20917 TaxID=1816218 RepID=UPI000878A876|nr:oligosaccharide flippase family protein [Colwellia sp. PAMC 20917]AOW77068.1 hypothetical protein A3Q34_09490 [Colwellia sp. PAMC 20917]
MSLKRNFTFTFIDNFVSFLVFLVSSMVISRLLTPDELGILAVAVSSIVLITMFKNFGYTTYLIREPLLDDTKKSAVFTLSIITSTALFLILFALAEFIGSAYGNQKITDIVYIISISIITSPFHIVATGLIERKEKFKNLAIINIASETLFFINVMLLIYLDFGIFAIAISNVLKSFMQIILMMWTIWDDFVFKISLKKYKPILSFGMKMSFMSSLSRIQELLIPLIIGKYFGLNFAAFYDKGKSLPKIILHVLLPALGTAAFPHYTKKVRNNEPLNDTILSHMQQGLLVFWPSLLAICLISPNLIYYMFGGQWGHSVPVASLLALASMFTIPVIFIRMGLVASGHENLALKFIVANKIALVLGVTLAFDYGINGVAFAILLAEVITLILSFAIIKKLDITAYNYVSYLSKPFIIAILSNIPFFILSIFWQHEIVEDIYVVFIAVVSFILIWTLLLFYLSPTYKSILLNLHAAVKKVF